MGRISAGFGSVHGPGKKRRAGRGTGGLPPLSLSGLSPLAGACCWLCARALPAAAAAAAPTPHQARPTGRNRNEAR